MRNKRPKHANGEMIPPPPGPESGYDSIIEYFNKYSSEELEAAGHLTTPSDRELSEMEAAGTYALLTTSGLPVRLPPKMSEKLVRLARRRGCKVEDLIRRWIKDRLGQAVRS